MVPIIPAIPRSLERRRLPKEHVKSSEDGGGTGGPIRPVSPNPKEESQLEAAIAQSQAELTGAPSDSVGKDDVREDSVQDAVIETTENGGSNEVAGGTSTFQSTIAPKRKKPTTPAVDGTNPTPVHAQDFGIEKHGFRLPPPFCPKQSPPLAISTDVSSANEQTTASEETSQTVEEEDGSNRSQQSSVESHVALNAAAPTFHAHPTPPTDVTTSPSESSPKGSDLPLSPRTQPGATLPVDDTLSPIQLPYRGYETSQNISFYAPPQSSNDPSSPNHSIYQGYAYAPTSYGYSPESYAPQQHSDSQQRTEVDVPYDQCYLPQPPYYSNQSSHPILGSQPPLTPSRTPLDPSAQPWSYSNGIPSTMSGSYGYVPSCYPQQVFDTSVRSASQGIIKSENSNRENDLLEETPELVQSNASEPKAAQLIRCAWSNANDYISSHVPLVEHLLEQFNVEEYADCQLTLIHEHLRFEKTTWSLSSLLLAQSRKLRGLLKSAGPGKGGKMSLEIRLADRFVTPWAMNSALRALYGERPEMFPLAIAHSSFGPNADMSALSMDACLAFAGAGYVLELESVVFKGLEVATSILDWDNLEHALSFGLESGPNPRISPSVDAIPLSAYSPVWSRESDPSSATNLTPPSSSTESKPERSRDEGLSSFNPHPSEVRSARDLQTYCLQWMASILDDSWEFDPSARPLAEVDRLPTTVESRSPLSKSRLSRIQFGDHPSEIHAKASDRNFLVSSIVLSLPFMALNYMLNLGSQPLLRQINAIVKERERRRQIVLQSKSVPWAQRLAAKEHEWAEVGYTEWVETTGDGQVALARIFTGIDRQISEPSTPGHQKR